MGAYVESYEDIYNEYYADYYNEIFKTISNVMSVVLFFVIIWALVSYVLQASAFYEMAKRRGFRGAWLGWLPIGNIWIIGAVADDYCFKAQGKKHSYRIILSLLYISEMILSVGISAGLAGMLLGQQSSREGLLLIYVALMVFSVVFAVYYYISLYWVYKSSNPDKAVAFLLLSIFIGLIQPFLISSCSARDEGLPGHRVEERPFFQSEEEYVCHDDDDNDDIEIEE